MDASVEQSCLEEISHTVLDSNHKISVRTLSNNYSITFLEAVTVLQKWIGANSAKANLTQEFIVRGIDSKLGSAFITVANEKKLKTITAKAKQVSSVLYSVEVAAESSRKIIVLEDQDFRVINLPLSSDKRDVKVFVPTPSAPVPVKQEPKSKSNSLFATSASKPVPKPEPPKPTIKEEKQSPPADSNKTSPKKTPTKSSPSKKKDAKKPVTGKASIASFFSNKPAAKPAAASVEIKTEKPSPKVEAKTKPKEETHHKAKEQPVKQEDESQRWKRMISDESEEDEVIPNTPQEQKEAKKGARKPMTFKKGGKCKPNPNKKSRILHIEDSSEEEDVMEKEPEERLIAIDIEDSDDVEMKEENTKEEVSLEKSVENDSNSLNRKKARVKKMVTKTFMDDEGYLTTVKEYEMVSASEDESDTTNNNTSGKQDAAKTTTAASVNGKAETKAADKKGTKVTPPTPKTKQGSIMSFFSKK